MNAIILTITMLIVSSTIQAGFIQTVVEMPGKAVEATGTVVKDVVTAPEMIVKDTVTAPAKVIGAVPMEEKKEAPAHNATPVAPATYPKEVVEMNITQTQEPAVLSEEETVSEEIPQEEVNSEVESNEQ
jgi:hypothetical protein